MNTTAVYDLIIIGAGVSGAAQYYAAGRYSDFKNVLVLDKEAAPGLINSAPTHNSQTLHEGDIETNYNLEKATAVQHKAFFTRAYLENYKADKHGELYIKGPKMVLGIGETEGAFLTERYQAFARLYPSLQKIGNAELATLEPKLLEGRPTSEQLTALYNEDGITINYQKLAAELIADGQVAFAAAPKRTGVVQFDSVVTEVRRVADGFTLMVNGQAVQTKYLSICAGAHSMYFAKKLQIPSIETKSLLLVAGNFYYTPKYLRSKVYTLQNPKLPFAAVHGDPDIMNQDTKTRYGPTTRIVAQLERGRFATTLEYLQTLSPVLGSLLAYGRILFDREFFVYALKHNLFFLLPGLGTYLFTKEIQKMIPSVTMSDVTRAKGQGGVRPQIVDTTQADPLNLGEAKIQAENIHFNVTPSPGASTCVYNGLLDLEHIAADQGVTFHTERVVKDFGRQVALNT